MGDIIKSKTRYDFMDYKALFDMTGKVCVITGGSGYLGSGNIKMLKEFGAIVVNADKVERDVGADMFFEHDISSTESFKALFKATYEKYGRIDVLINCATFCKGHGSGNPMEEMPDDVWQVGIEGSLNSTFRAIREVVPYMKENGGSIINYCSMYGLVSPDLRIYGPNNPQKNPPNYGAAKAGVDQLTRYAAGALAQYGIRVNSVTPGPFPAPGKDKDPEFNKALSSKTMLGRFGKNYEMAGAVLLLASDASSFTTGANYIVDGGWTAW